MGAAYFYDDVAKCRHVVLKIYDIKLVRTWYKHFIYDVGLGAYFHNLFESTF